MIRRTTQSFSAEKVRGFFVVVSHEYKGALNCKGAKERWERKHQGKTMTLQQGCELLEQTKESSIDKIVTQVSIYYTTFIATFNDVYSQFSTQLLMKVNGRKF